MPVAEATFLTMFIMFLGAAIVAAICGILLALFLLMTPARTFLKARMRKKPIVAVFRRDGKIDLTIAKEYMQGIVRTGSYGAFIINEDGAYSESKSGAVMLLASAEHGITKSPEWLQLIDAMKFNKFDSITDAKIANEAYHTCQDCGYTGYMIPAVDDQGQPTMNEDGTQVYMCPNIKLEEAKDVPEEKGTEPATAS